MSIGYEKNIEVIELKGPLAGPSLVILGGVHGNELCGVEAIKTLSNKLNLKKGKVFFLIANLEAIAKKQRYVESDLNRAFFSKFAETLEEKTAEEIKTYLDQADALLDLHASTSRNSEVFIICGPQSVPLARFLPGNKIVTGIDSVHPGSTDNYMNVKCKQAVCVECGFYNDERSVIVAKKAIKNFLVAFDMLESSLDIRTQKIFSVESLYVAKQRFNPIKEFKDFEFVTKGNIIGLDGLTKIIANKNCRILFVRSADKGHEAFLTLE